RAQVPGRGADYEGVGAAAAVHVERPRRAHPLDLDVVVAAVRLNGDGGRHVARVAGTQVHGDDVLALSGVHRQRGEALVADYQVAVAGHLGFRDPVVRRRPPGGAVLVVDVQGILLAPRGGTPVDRQGGVDVGKVLAPGRDVKGVVAGAAVHAHPQGGRRRGRREGVDVEGVVAVAEADRGRPDDVRQADQVVAAVGVDGDLLHVPQREVALGVVVDDDHLVRRVVAEGEDDAVGGAVAAD